ncbi:hypothetical protein [Luteimonas vadosa]|uniref:hypothetical protein n=1 Tax=Luteimonas vadosa TaxID=1165507 RepID=UPI0031E9D972
MKHLVVTLRLFAWTLAALMWLIVLLTLTGWVPFYSEETQIPGFWERAVSILPVAAACIVLFLPHALFIRANGFAVLLALHLLLLSAVLGLVIRDTTRYLDGAIHIAAVYGSVIVFLVIAGNAVALWLRCKKLPPNNSFKPNPHRCGA